MNVINGAEVWGKGGLKIKYDQTHVSYKKGNYATSVSAEFVLNPVMLVIYIDTLTSWYPPHKDEKMNDFQKKEAIDEIKKALSLLNVKYEISSKNNI